MAQLSTALFFSCLVLAGCGNVKSSPFHVALEGTSHFSPHGLILSSWLKPQRQQGLNVKLPKV